MLRLKKERDRETEIAIHTSKYRNARVCKLGWVFGWMEWIVMVIVAQGATSTEGWDSAGLKIAPANTVTTRRLHSFLIRFKKSALIYSIDPSVCVTPTVFNVIVLCGCIQLDIIAVLYCHSWFQEESYTFRIRMSFIARYVYTYEELVFMAEATAVHATFPCTKGSL